MKTITSKFISGLLIFSGSILALSLYVTTAERIGLLSKLQYQQSPDEMILIFSALLAIPAGIICFWPLLVRREVLLPPVRVGGDLWRIEITRWRVGFVVALIGWMILELVF